MYDPLTRQLDRRTVMRGLFGAATLAVAGPVLAACSGGTEEAEVPGLTTVTAQLGWKKLSQFGGHFAALKNNYFQDEGINAVFLSGGPNIDPVKVVSTGQADIGDANGSDIIIASSQGIPVQAFATIYQETPNALMSLKSNPVTTLAQMSGKTVGLPTGEQALLKAMLTKAGVDPATVTMVPVGTDPSILSSRQVDGYIGYGTQQGLSLQQQGVDVDIIYFAELGNPDYGNALFATTDTISDKADVLTKWLRADKLGWDYFVAHPEEIAQYTWDQYHQETGAVLADEKLSAAAAVPLITSGAAQQHGVMWIEPTTFTTIAELYADAGDLKGEVDADAVMTQSILTAVAKET
jgi:ABC-type nitrate/sulfonate/bicarbonate transport system substrate-binding protein